MQSYLLRSWLEYCMSHPGYHQIGISVHAEVEETDAEFQISSSLR